MLCASASGEAPPRYQLRAGDYLAYERSVKSVSNVAGRGSEPGLDYQDAVQIWCLGRESDAWLMLGVLVRRVGAHDLPASGVLFRMDERGRKRIAAENLGRVGDLDAVFEVLPECRGALDSPGGWLTEADWFGRRWKCRDTPGEAGMAGVALELEDTTGVAKALGQRVTGEYEFDRRQGVVRSLECRVDRGERGAQVVSARLRERQELGPAWIAQRLVEMEGYRRTNRLEDRCLAGLETDPAQLESALQRIEAAWREYERELSASPGAGDRSSPGSPLRAVAQGRLAVALGRREAFVERARVAAAWNGRAAPHWSLQDLDGRMLTSEKVREQPSVECYWRSDDLGSLRMMLTLRRLQESAGASGLRIVCVNIDADPRAWREAARGCGAGLQHVFAGPPLETDWPRELPVTRIVGRDGRIGRVVVGWRATLEEEVGSVVRH